MKCIYCEFETNNISEQEANQELENHYVNVHPESCVSENQVLSILEYHCKYEIPIDTLIADFFEIRSKLSQEFKNRELKERFGR